MSLIVEDGTGLSTAESYVSVAGATARQAALGNTNWALLSTAEMEQALRRATQYMLQAFRDRWTGDRLNGTQALDWPRWNVWVDGYPVSPSVVPADIANACADLALKAAAGDLNADLTRGVVREKVGPIETEYDRYSPQNTRFRAIDMALSPYLKGSSAMAKLVRA
jgi:hypothetical protein